MRQQHSKEELAADVGLVDPPLRVDAVSHDTALSEVSPERRRGSSTSWLGDGNDRMRPASRDVRGCGLPCSGRPWALGDRPIAGIVLANQAVLLTRDTRHVERGAGGFASPDTKNESGYGGDVMRRMAIRPRGRRDVRALAGKAGTGVETHPCHATVIRTPTQAAVGGAAAIAASRSTPRGSHLLFRQLHLHVVLRVQFFFAASWMALQASASCKASGISNNVFTSSAYQVSEVEICIHGIAVLLTLVLRGQRHQLLSHVVHLLLGRSVRSHVRNGTRRKPFDEFIHPVRVTAPLDSRTSRFCSAFRCSWPPAPML